MSDLVKRTFRIRKDQDKKIKRLARKGKSENQVVREGIDMLTLSPNK